MFVVIWRLRFYFVYLYRGIAVPLVFHSKHSLSSVQDLQAVARLHEVIWKSRDAQAQFLGLWLEGWCYIICLCYILYKIYCNVILYNVFDMFDKLYTIHLRASIPSFFWGGQSWYHRNHLDRWWFPNAFLFAPTEWWTASWCATITTRKVWFEASSWAKREVSFVTKTWGRLKSNGLCFAWFIIKLESIISRYTHTYIYIYYN